MSLAGAAPLGFTFQAVGGRSQHPSSLRISSKQNPECFLLTCHTGRMKTTLVSQLKDGTSIPSMFAKEEQPQACWEQTSMLQAEITLVIPGASWVAMQVGASIRDCQQSCWSASILSKVQSG